MIGRLLLTGLALALADEPTMPAIPAPVAARQSASPTPTYPAPVAPIDLAAALRLADAQNAAVGLARERLREAFARQKQAGVMWLPNVFVGGVPDSQTFLPLSTAH